MMKPIKDFPGYFVDEKANVYSTKYKQIRILKQYKSKSGTGYYMVDLCKEGKVYKRLVHRLVAEAFVPNPNNLPVVDHKNDDKEINEAWNLQWVTDKENVHKTYKKMSSTRNYRECELYKDGVFIKSFQSVKEACRYAKDNFSISSSSLDKYRKVKGYEIISKKNVTTSPEGRRVEIVTTPKICDPTE